MTLASFPNHLPIVFTFLTLSKQVQKHYSYIIEMISGKTATIIFFLILAVKISSSSKTRGSRSSAKSVLKIRRKVTSGKGTNVLMDMVDNVKDVEVQEGSTLHESAPGTSKTTTKLVDTTDIVNNVFPKDNQITTQVPVWQRLSSWPKRSIAEKFKRFMDNGKYWMAICLAKTMSDDDLLNLVCSVVKTVVQYNGLVGYLKSRNLVASFYIYGDIGVVRKAIIANSNIYDNDKDYVDGSDLETALPLALNSDCHDRVIELLNVRQEVTAEEDKQKGIETSFERFVYYFLRNLAHWKDDTAPRRFLALRKDELRTKYSVVLDTLCEMLVLHLRHHRDEPKAANLLIDMIGQPSLLTPVLFTKGFLGMAFNDKIRSDFIKYGWAAAFQEGLQRKYWNGGENLWQTMKEDGWVQPPEKFPETEEERADVCKRFPTKQKREEEWAQFALKNATILSTKLKSLDFISGLISSDLLPIIADYAISMVDIDSTISRSELISSNPV
jgi:hypothetical protein